MIRVSISSKNNQMIQQSFEQFFQKEHLEYCIVPYQKQSYQDIYIFEIQNKEDLQLIANHPYSPYSLYYVIGPEDYAITSECIRLKVDLYFSKQAFIKELEKYKDYIGHIHIAENHRYQPGTGSIDFRRHMETLKRIGYDGAVVNEGRIRGEDPLKVYVDSIAYMKQFM